MKQYYSEELVEKHFKGATIVPPQKIGNFPGTNGITMTDVYTKGQYFAQLKKDGCCYLYNRGKEDSAYLFSRVVSKSNGLPTQKIDNVPHIKEALHKLPNDTIIVGEIYFPFGTSKDASTIMGCLPKKAIERQSKGNKISYYMFDIIMLNGKDLTKTSALERHKILTELVEEHKLLENDFLELAKVYLPEECDLHELATTALANGEEGIVLKKKQGLYHPGLRPAWETIKIKKNDTVDVVCMGFENGKREYEGTELTSWKYFDENGVPVTKAYYMGWYAAIKIGLYKNGELISIGTVSSGLSDAMKESITKDSDKYIGECMEVGIMEKGESALRHPTFIRFRDDKTSEECTWESVF